MITINIMKRKFVQFILWVFAEPTRIVELGSGLTAFFFALAFLIDYDLITVLPSYAIFPYITAKWSYLILLVVSVIQVYFTIFSDEISKLKRAQFLLWAGTAYAVIASTFVLSYPPLSTGFFTYFIISCSNLAAYAYLEITTDKIQLLNRLKCNDVKD